MGKKKRPNDQEDLDLELGRDAPDTPDGQDVEAKAESRAGQVDQLEHMSQAGPIDQVEQASQGGQADVVVSDAEQELAAVRDQMLRTAAEFDNYRKRTARERAETWSRAQAALATRMLDALDDMHRVLELDLGSAHNADLMDGIRMVHRKLLKELEDAGLAAIGNPGDRFDPTKHEAVGTVPTDRREEDGTVADVFQVGYRFGTALLRPARVRVKVVEEDPA